MLIDILKNHKPKIIAAAIIAVVLAGAWFYGGNYPERQGKAGSGQWVADSGPWAVEEAPHVIAPEEPLQTAAACSLAGAANGPLPESFSGAENREAVWSASATDNVSWEEAVPALTPTATELATETATAALEIVPAIGNNKHLTGPAPEGKPLPVEPQDATVGDGSFTVTLTVRCDTILNNMGLLSREKHGLVPEDGVIFPATAVTAYEGESVFNVLHRTMKQANIHMAFRNTPIYNSAYIEAINNLYEFGVGELSGWIYCVNGWYPNYGCSRYLLKPGDAIEWNYTCGLGRDLGQDWLSGGQIDE